MQLVIGHDVDSGNQVKIDIQRLLEGRMLIQANSGGGKSYCVRKFAEVTYGKVQQIIIDIEGEFASLREKFDYVLVGKEGDIPINLRAAELLARRLLELGTSAIIDLYELQHHERKRFVKMFLNSMINSPKELWHPVFVILDEIHQFGPETHSGEAESLEAVKDMATRGRKRGFALIGATQRLSKVHKDIVAELNTKLIGRCSLDVDMKRAAFELGLTTKEDILKLRQLNKGEFFSFGPALTNNVVKIKIDKVETTHQEAGIVKQVKTATPDKIKKVLEKLADLPKEAEEEIKSKEDMQKKMLELKKELSEIRTKNTQISSEQISNMENIAYIKGLNDANRKATDILLRVKRQLRIASNALKRVVEVSNELNKNQQIINEIDETVQGSILGQDLKPAMESLIKAKIQPKKESKTNNDVISIGEATLGKCERMCLKSLAQRNKPSSKRQIAVISGYSVKSGGFNNSLSKLKTMDLITEQNGQLEITSSGRILVSSEEQIKDDTDSLLSFWKSKLGRCSRSIIESLPKDYGVAISKDEIASITNYSVSSGGFNNSLSELASLGIIEKNNDGTIQLSKEMFPILN